MNKIDKIKLLTKAIVRKSVIERHKVKVSEKQAKKIAIDLVTRYYSMNNITSLKNSPIPKIESYLNCGEYLDFTENE